MQVASYSQQSLLASSSISASYSLLNQEFLASGADLTQANQAFADRAIEDILDIRAGIQQQLDSQQDFIVSQVDNVFTGAQIYEELEAFEDQVFALFDAFLSQAKDFFANGGMGDAFANGVESTKAFYFEIEASFEIQITQTTQTNNVSNLTLEALDTVASAQISNRDKEALFELIAMFDEFLKGGTKKSLLNALIALVPLMEATTDAGAGDSYQTSLYEAFDNYVSKREALRESTGYKAPAQAGQSANYSAEMQYVSASYNSTYLQVSA
jgi:hypothetical protein